MKKTDSTRGIGLLVSAGGVFAMLHFKHKNEESGKWYGKSDYSAGKVS